VTALTWVGISLCILQAGVFSGLNLAFFSISKLKLEVAAAQGNRKALLISKLRKDANFLLASILWGNVAVNVLLTLLSNSILAGASAFLFSTVVITLLGEIVPQAYFSRHALNAAYFLSPMVRFYMVLFYPIAKPTALLLNALLGHEPIRYFGEDGLKRVIKMHMAQKTGDIEHVEGQGALNFFSIDDLSVLEEGEKIHPQSLVQLNFENGLPVFPNITRSLHDPFLERILKSERRWVVFTDDSDMPVLAAKTDHFLRDVLYGTGEFAPLSHCHRPIIIRDTNATLGDVLPLLSVHPEHGDDDVVDNDIIIVWSGDVRRIITGTDVLGRLLRGIVAVEGE
jgi:metal transporter CNNM